MDVPIVEFDDGVGSVEFQGVSRTFQTRAEGVRVVREVVGVGNVPGHVFDETLARVNELALPTGWTLEIPL